MSNIDIAEKEMIELLKKYGLRLEYSVSFPRYNILPEEAKLALLVLNRHGMKIRVILKESK